MNLEINLEIVVDVEELYIDLWEKRFLAAYNASQKMNAFTEEEREKLKQAFEEALVGSIEARREYTRCQHPDERYDGFKESLICDKVMEGVLAQLHGDMLMAERIQQDIDENLLLLDEAEEESYADGEEMTFGDWLNEFLAIDKDILDHTPIALYNEFYATLCAWDDLCCARRVFFDTRLGLSNAAISLIELQLEHILREIEGDNSHASVKYEVLLDAC